MRVTQDVYATQEVQISTLQSVELIRFLAAFSVVIWHYQFYFFEVQTGTNSPSRLQLPLSGPLSLLYNSGSYAVQRFWVLSGYIFFFNYREALSNRTMAGFDFFFRRFARLYPLHLATLIIVSLQLLFYRFLFDDNYPYYTSGVTVWTFVNHLFMASNWTSTQYTLNGPVWSVSVEVLIYILFFNLTKYASMIGITRTFLIAITSFFLYCLAVKRGLGTPTWIAECATCFYKRYMLDTLAGARQGLFWTALAAALVVLYQFRPTYAMSFCIPASAILFIVCSDAIERSSIVAKLARVGNWTYSSYLLHFPVALVIVMGYGWRVWISTRFQCSRYFSWPTLCWYSCCPISATHSSDSRTPLNTTGHEVKSPCHDRGLKHYVPASDGPKPSVRRDAEFGPLWTKWALAAVRQFYG